MFVFVLYRLVFLFELFSVVCFVTDFLFDCFLCLVLFGFVFVVDYFVGVVKVCCLDCLLLLLGV